MNNYKQMDKNNIKFSDKVMLIDAALIEKVAFDFRRHFSNILSRELPKADLALFLECITLEAGIKGDNNSIQVLFVYDSNSKRLDSFTPSSLKNEIDSMAFKSNLGEFSLFSFQPSDMVTREELFNESMRVVLDSSDVKSAIIIPSEELTNDEIKDTVSKVDGKESIIFFGMNPLSLPDSAKWVTMGYTLMKALGIRADEL